MVANQLSIGMINLRVVENNQTTIACKSIENCRKSQINEGDFYENCRAVFEIEC